MTDKKKEGRYNRIYTQLEELLQKTGEPLARMATICAVLHHKMDHYFWTGFYLLKEDQLIVGPYQGPVACQELEKNKGVCWAAVNQKNAVLVEDVHSFPDHISCDSRSQSEIALPVFDREKNIRAVFDVDSDKLNAFTITDQIYLEKILDLIYFSLKNSGF